MRDLFTKVLKNHGDTDDEIYDWMLLNNGRGIEKRTSRHHSQRQTAMATRNPTDGYPSQQQQQQKQQHHYQQQQVPVPQQTENPYGRTQPPMNVNPPPNLTGGGHEYDDSSRKKGFWQQFISFVTCGLCSCL